MGWAGLSLYSVSLTTAAGVKEHISLIQAHLRGAVEIPQLPGILSKLRVHSVKEGNMREERLGVRQCSNCQLKTTLQAGLSISKVHLVAQRQSLCYLLVSIVTPIVKILVTLLKNAMGPINDINHGEMCKKKSREVGYPTSHVLWLKIFANTITGNYFLFCLHL